MAEDDKSLDDILSSKPAEEAPVEETPVEEPAEPIEAEPVEKPGEPTEDQLQELLKEEPAPPAETQPLTRAEFKGMTDERDKRQRAEREVERLQQQLSQQPPSELPDVDEDPAGHIAAQMQAMQSQLSAQADQRFYDTSKFSAQSTHDDFDDVYEHFKTLAAQNPALNQTAAAHAHPFEFAYQTATQDIEATRVRENGGVEAMLEKAGQEAYAKARAELEAEFKEKTSAIAPSKELPPATLASETSSAARTGPQWAGPQPLSKIVGGGLAE